MSSRSQAPPGNALLARQSLAVLRCQEARQSLASNAFPGRAWERERWEARSSAWLAATAARLPVHRQPASEINPLLRRPPGWLEKHAGIEARCLWLDEDPLDAAADAAWDCLRQAGLAPTAVGALLVTSEAPPLLPGLAAALHTRLDLPSSVAALEIGGACTGFLMALWTASRLLADAAAVLVIAVEAPSRWLSLAPTPAGEAAALFGDGAAACLLTARPTTAGIWLSATSFWAAMPRPALCFESSMNWTAACCCTWRASRSLIVPCGRWPMPCGS